MLALQFIRENKEVILKGLEKRNFKHPELIDAIIDLDQERRSQQATLDQHLARANQLAKEIGGLFKSGEIEKATVLKEETASLKTQTKTLQEKLQETSDSLFELRTQIPNVHTKAFLREQMRKIMKRFLNQVRFPSWTIKHFLTGN